MLRTGLLLITLTAFMLPAHAQAPTSEGVAAFDRGDYRTAAPILSDQAERGDARAQVYLGLMHFNGTGVAEDDAASFDWFRRSAEQGYAEGQFQLGFMYAFDYGVPADETAPMERAAQWFRAAADQDHADAQYNLGLLYLAGSGVVMDEAEGLRWIRRAGDNGSQGALRFLGEID